MATLTRGLNPCFNGRYSQRKVRVEDPKPIKGLNPCFNGRYSQRKIQNLLRLRIRVLILVLMEDTLREQNLRILEFRGFDNSKTYKIGFC